MIPELRLSHSKQLHKQYSSNDIGIISVHWRKDIYGGHTEKPTESLDSTHLQQDVVTKRLHIRLCCCPFSPL